jgi:CelD/BcsL family acetyltransferase involved in cellulose biosynthesis
MNIRTTTFEQLTSDELIDWSNIQRSEPTLWSPYFRPEFAQAVNAVQSDVEVALLEGQGRPIGFFPFQRSRWNDARPVGGHLSDFHGIIAGADVICDPLELLRACRLRTWQFDQLPVAQTSFAPFTLSSADSPYIDLTNGLDGYVAEKENGRRIMSKIGQKMRKLAREFGPIRYTPHDPDRKILSTLLSWKSDQFLRARVPNIFDHRWVRNLLDTISEYQGENFSSVVSTVYAGDQLAAINFGMRSRGVLHPWFTAYNVELAKYSPGYVHWIETLKAASTLGIRRIDFGKGPEAYKRRFMNGATKVAEGIADVRPSATVVRRALQFTGARIRKSPLANSARVTARIVRRLRHQLEVRSALTR